MEDFFYYGNNFKRVGVLWCLTLLSTIFQLYRIASVLLVEETGVLVKTTDLSQVTGKLYHIMLDRVHIA